MHLIDDVKRPANKSKTLPSQVRRRFTGEEVYLAFFWLRNSVCWEGLLRCPTSTVAYPNCSERVSNSTSYQNILIFFRTMSCFEKNRAAPEFCFR